MAAKNKKINWIWIVLAIALIVLAIALEATGCSAIPDRVTDKALDQIEFFNEKNTVYIPARTVECKFDTSTAYYEKNGWAIRYLPDGRLLIKYNIRDTLIVTDD